MSTLLQIQGARKSYGIKHLLENASFAVNEGEHVGVIGPNGAGKTTLFKILIGQEILDSGEVIRSSALRLGYLAQHDVFGAEETGETYLSRDTLLPLWELKALGRKLGLSEERLSVPLNSLSGGYRMRVKLLRLLGQEPNLMLLDEPTNYLDLETLLVLEEFLLEYKGAFLLISHDREFLKRTTDHILEIEQGDMNKFPGTIDDYFEQKEMLRAQLEARAMSAEARRREVLDFAARFGAKATKARQVQSRLKSLDRMETIEVKALPVQAKIRIPTPPRVGKLVLECEKLDAGFATKTVLRDISLQLEGGDHVGVVGLNGAGKTTLLRTLAGDLPPLKSEIRRGYEIDVSYYGQHVAERLNPKHTVYEALNSVTGPDISPQEIKDLAGSLLFSGDDIQKKVSVLSGGEKSRVALGQVLLRRAACLLLDEPTNHLDFYTVEALTQALQAYPGTVIVVSHDRGFIRRVATKILEVREGQARIWPGTYDDYVWSITKGVLSGGSGGRAKSSEAQTGGTPLREAPQLGEGQRLQVAVGFEGQGLPAENALGPAARANFKERRAQIDKRLRQVRKRVGEIEKHLETQQTRMTELNAKLLDAKGDEAREFVTQLAYCQRELDERESEWMQLGEEEAALQKELGAMGVKV